MTPDVAAAPPTPTSMPKVLPARGEARKLPDQDPSHDPDKFIKTARQVVVDQINNSKNNRSTRRIDEKGVYVVWFTKVLGNWKAIVASPIVRTYMWEVTYNGGKDEIYIDVYRRQESVKIISGKV